MCYINYLTFHVNVLSFIDKLYITHVKEHVNTFYRFSIIFLCFCNFPCKRAKERHPHINIDLVHTSTSIMRPDGISNDPSLGFSTLIYDIETVHFKRRITYSNRRMIDECDLLICFVEEIITTGGAAAAYRYAKKKNKKIINIF